jgi:hypothetical protein
MYYTLLTCRDEQPLSTYDAMQPWLIQELLIQPSQGKFNSSTNIGSIHFTKAYDIIQRNAPL